MSFHPHTQHDASAQDAARAPATSSDPSQGVDRTGTGDSSFSALSEVGVAPKHLPHVGVGERNRAVGGHSGGADVARDDPETASAAGAPHNAPQHPESKPIPPPPPVPCEAFEINMDILREILAEQRAAPPPPDTPTIAAARASSTTLPYLTPPTDANATGRPSDTSTQPVAQPGLPASALSITSAKSGVPGSTPCDPPAVDAQVEAWSADEAGAARAPADAPPSQEPASPLSKGVVEPIHGGFYLAEPSPGTTSFPAGELPRLSNSEQGDGTDESEEDRGTRKRVPLAARLRGEAKVIAGKIKNDDAKIARGRALKSGEAL